jgi:tellurite resistance protein TehA-like permease
VRLLGAILAWVCFTAWGVMVTCYVINISENVSRIRDLLEKK